MPQKPGGDARTPGRALDVRSLRDLVAASAAAAPPIAIDRPYAEALRNNEDVKEFYLGLSTAGRRSYRDVKHYRRRKRWLA